jgi:hypothetical protein
MWGMRDVGFQCELSSVTKFPAIESHVDARGSFHINRFINKKKHRRALGKGRGTDPPIFKFEI